MFAALRLLGNVDGLVVTVPHKVAMLDLVDRLTDRARLAGALNLARREPDGSWLGDMVDGVGFCGGLSASGFNLTGRSAFIAGAGGAGSAVAAELARAGVRLHIFDAAAGRAAGLAARLRAAGYDVEVATLPHPLGADLVVNATPLGMQPDNPMPIDPGLLSPEMLVAEVVMKPPVTAFLQAARDRGCRMQLGEAVMLHQLDAMLDFFLGTSPGRAADACP